MDAKYMALVTSFPLLPITNKGEHSAAKQMIIELTKRDGELSPSEVGYGKVLVQIIQAYERQQVTNFLSNVSGAEALEYLLDEHQMTQTEAAEIAGISKQNLNDFLKRRGRGLSKQARIRIAKHFKVDPNVFEAVQELSSA